MRSIIGLAGKMRSGKGVLGEYLHQKYGYTIVAFYDHLKEICTKLLGLDSVAELDMLKNGNTEIAMYFNQDLCNRFADAFDVDRQFFGDIMLDREISSVRELLQTIGTDVLRVYDENWHVNRLIDRIVAIVHNGGKVAVTDVRFPNEKAKIEGIGGEVYYVDREVDDERATHIAETSLSPSNFNERFVLKNDSDIGTLISEFEKRLHTQQDAEDEANGYAEIKECLAYAFMDYLDKNRSEVKMCLSNMECIDIRKAFDAMDWKKLYRYVLKFRV